VIKELMEVKEEPSTHARAPEELKLARASLLSNDISEAK
jgi:hypothetical protein